MNVTLINKGLDVEDKICILKTDASNRGNGMIFCENREKDLKDFILKIEEANKTNDTMDSEKKFTRITHESSYGVKTVLNFDSEDLGPEDYIQAIVTIMVSATFVPVTIYRTMYEYSRDALKALGDEEV